MTLSIKRINPLTFQFNQANLQDYQDCKRRFYLKYILHLAWPAAPAEPVAEFENHLRKGEIFHRLAHQYFIGIPEKSLDQIAQREEVLDWWRPFLVFARRNFALQDTLQPERKVLVKGKDYKFAVRYDLLAVTQENVHVYDWKTSYLRYSQDTARNRIQTRVYLYVLSHINLPGLIPSSIPFEKMRLTYWFAQFPEQAISLDYDESLYQEDEQFLTHLIEEILYPENDYKMTDDERHCRYCTFRSLCDRGIQAGVLSADNDEFLSGHEAETELEFNFNEIPEIEF
jgi:hypothetical protein